MNKPEILIVGGTGNIGSELTRLLAEAGIPIRVLLRQKSTGRLPQHENIEIAYGDLSDLAAIDIALKDIRKVYLLTRDQPQQAQLEGNLIELAKPAGVEKIVKSSAFAAGLEPPVGFGITHFESEQKLIASGINWVILRPYMFMQNFLDLAQLIVARGLLPLPLGQARIGLIDARDVARVAKTVITKEKFDNNIYELRGICRGIPARFCIENIQRHHQYALIKASPLEWCLKSGRS